MTERQQESASREEEVEQWTELRDLLAGPERRRLDDISVRLDDPLKQAEEVSRALPDAIALARQRGDRVARALEPVIEDALRSLVRRDPRTIADGIFPVLGPAIRRALQALLARMVQTLEVAVDRSFSLQGIKWRIEALRAQRPYAEVVLLHTLVYRVEQVFLIHRKSGLLLAHADSEWVESRDADLVSGMLTAIQDFVQDSFDVDDEALDTLTIGEHVIWIEAGPEAFLAVVVRGTPPLEVRERFRSIIDDIHLLFARHWDSWSGDTSVFAVTQPKLEEALTSQEREPESSGRPLLWAIGTVLAVAIGVQAVSSFVAAKRWQHLLDSVRAEPGFVLLDASDDDGFSIHALRDPLAGDPHELPPRAGMSADTVQWQLVPFYSLDERFVLRRAERALEPPASVTLSVDGGTLTIGGRASHAWIERASEDVRAIVGVERTNTEALVNETRAALEEAARELEQTRVYFDVDVSSLRDDQGATLDRVVALERKIRQLSHGMSAAASITIVGRADPTGGVRRNQALSQRRATSVRDLMIGRGADGSALIAVGVRSEKTGSTTQGDELALYRNVGFDVDLPDSSEPR